MTMEVNVLSKKLIKPSTPTPNHPKTYKLSFFDQLAPPAHIPLIFFFTADDDTNKEMVKIDRKLQQLEKSLSEILTLFYPEAGRFVNDDLLIDCNDQGVEFLEAKVNVQLKEFLNQGPKLELVNHFVPWGIGPAKLATTPTVAIQATVFECGGLAICVHASHIVNDGFTGSRFIQAWATASRLGLSKVVCPSFDLPSLFPSRDVSAVLKATPPKDAGAKVITRRFLFDAATISAFKQEVKDSISEREPSKLEVVMASTWKALIRLNRVKHEGKLRPSVMTLPVNLRGRTALETPKNSFGNFYMTCPSKFEPEESETTLLSHLVGLIRNTVRNTLAKAAKLTNADEVFAALLNDLNVAIRAVIDEEVDAHFFTTMCGFSLYDTDFGFGKPFLVSNASVPMELISLMDTKCGTGIEVWVSLKQPDMAVLEKDTELGALMIMG
ncbi:unnamed protein product [Camellia sinensis]